MRKFYRARFAALAAVVLSLAATAVAQSAGNSGSIGSTVTDPTGAVVSRARVEIRNPVSGFDRSTTTDSSGRFQFTNIPFNPYHLTVTAPGFAAYVQDVEPRSSVPLSVAIKMQVAGLALHETVSQQ